MAQDMPPPYGSLTEIAPGLMRTRLALPFRLDHVNVYFIRDGKGWMIVDAGISDAATEAAWEAILDDPMRGERFTGLIATHAHPDHIGLAGWLCARLGVPLITSRTSFLAARMFLAAPGLMAAPAYRQFYLRHGMDEEVAAVVASQGHAYLGMVSQLPVTYSRLREGQELAIGERRFRVIEADGHSAGQVMLYEPRERLLIAADQLIERISPNVSVVPYEPEENPLGDYITSLRRMITEIPADARALPGHHSVIVDPHRRARELLAHHDERCEMIMTACRERARSAAELVPVMFTRSLTPHEMSFAFGEVLAHLNHLTHEGRLGWHGEEAGILRAYAL